MCALLCLVPGISTYEISLLTYLYRCSYMGRILIKHISKSQIRSCPKTEEDGKLHFLFSLCRATGNYCLQKKGLCTYLVFQFMSFCFCYSEDTTFEILVLVISGACVLMFNRVVTKKEKGFNWLLFQGSAWREHTETPIFHYFPETDMLTDYISCCIGV